MKNSRKKDLKNIRNELLKLNALVIERMAEIKDELEQLSEALEEQYDNLSERSQEGEAGEKIQDDITDISYLIGEVETIADADPEEADESVFDSILTEIDAILDK